MNNETNDIGGTIIAKWAAAMNDIINPGHAVLARPTAVVVLAGQVIDQLTLISLAEGANAVGADLIYLSFEEGQEAKGPSEIISVAYREPVHICQRDLKLWIGDDGEVMLHPEGMKGAHTFTVDGMDYVAIQKSRLTKKGFERGLAKVRAKVEAPGARQAGKSFLKAA